MTQEEAKQKALELVEKHNIGYLARARAHTHAIKEQERVIEVLEEHIEWDAITNDKIVEEIKTQKLILTELKKL